MNKLNHETKEFAHEDTLDIEFIEYNLTEDEGESTGDSENSEKFEDEKEKKFNWKKELFSWVLMLVIAIGIASLISNFILINAYIPTGSMEDTIPKKSRLVGFRLAYTFGEPERGDIIIFKNPNDPEENYVKRIIGMPGETVVLENSQIYVYNSDGSLKVGPLNEPYLKDKYWMSMDEKYEFHIPENRYLVLGDNRNNSADARTWYNMKGDVEEIYIHKDKILAKALFIYWDSFHIFKDIEY